MEKIIQKIMQKRASTKCVKSKKVYKKILNLLNELSRKNFTKDSETNLEKILSVFNDDSLSLEATKEHLEKLKTTLIKDYNFLPNHHFTGRGTAIGAGCGICCGVVLGIYLYGFPMGLINGLILGSGVGLSIGYIVGSTMDNKAKSKNRILYHL